MKFSGIVKKHLGRGTTLGFPTANIAPPDDAEEGIFVGFATVDPFTKTAQKLPALIFIGSNVTFNETFRWAEIYILDFSGDLYGKSLEIETLKKIREVEKFNSSEELVTQIKKDEEVAKQFFEEYNKFN